MVNNKGNKMKFTDYIKEKTELEEASWVNGKKQNSTDLVWKSTQLSKEEAIKKYGKDNVKIGKSKRGTGDEDVQILVPLEENAKADKAIVKLQDHINKFEINVLVDLSKDDVSNYKELNKALDAFHHELEKAHTQLRK